MRAKTNTKKALIAKVHIAKKDLSLDDDTYRDVLWRVTGKRSCAQMSITELEAVIKDCEKKGWTGKRTVKKPDVTVQKKALVSKIEAILADMKLPWAYADGMAKQMFSVDKVQWLKTDSLYKLTQALAVHQRRQARADAKAAKAAKDKKDTTDGT